MRYAVSKCYTYLMCNPHLRWLLLNMIVIIPKSFRALFKYKSELWSLKRFCWHVFRLIVCCNRWWCKHLLEMVIHLSMFHLSMFGLCEVKKLSVRRNNSRLRKWALLGRSESCKMSGRRWSNDTIITTTYNSKEQHQSIALVLCACVLCVCCVWVCDCVWLPRWLGRPTYRIML